MTLSNELQIEYLPIKQLKEYNRKLRIPKKKQISKTIRMIDAFGLVTPLVIDSNHQVVIGAHLYEAAKQMNVDTVPVVVINHLNEAQIRMLRVAYDRIAEEAEWDKENLALEFRELEVLLPQLDLTITGFEVPEIDLIIGDLGADPEDEVPEITEGEALTKLGDVWQLGDHRLHCGDALDAESYKRLLGEELAQMCFTDAPYNVKIDGHVGNSGKTKHREFEMASGEMSADAFTQFLTTAHKMLAQFSQDGAIVYSCMDWRHLAEILEAGKQSELSLQNLCVWAKDNGGMGSLYRSRHELVLVFKNGTAKHINNIELGKYGRYRTNVWEYPGVNSFGNGRMNELELHPTVKPVAMIADAIKDCSKRGGIILDPFGGSGSTLMAAERTGRKSRLIEIDPHYCDVIVKRWQGITGQTAVKLDQSKKKER